MANYTKTTIGKENRIELHEKLSLTGAEISLNELPAGANVPFVHSHGTPSMRVKATSRRPNGGAHTNLSGIRRN